MCVGMVLWNIPMYIHVVVLHSFKYKRWLSSFHYQAADELRQKQEDSDELLRQTEEDADEEILALKSRYERQLRQQVDDNLKLKGDAGILKKKV